MRAPSRRHLAVLAALGGLVSTHARAEDGVLVRSIGPPPATTAALLARGGEGGTLRAELTALPFASSDERAVALVVVEIDGSELLAGHPGGLVGVELHLYVVAPGRRIVASLSEGVAVELASQGEALERDGLRWLGRLELPPGDYRLRLHLRERRTGAFVLREAALTLPARPEAGPAQLTAAVPAGPAWLDARSPSVDADLLDAVARAGGPPAALPVLPSGGLVRLAILAAGAEPPPFEARLGDPSGLDAGPIPLDARGGTSLLEGVEALFFEAALPEGRGLVELRLVAPESGEALSKPLRVVLRDARRLAAWHALDRIDLAAARREPQLAPARAAEALPERERRALAARVLDSWRRFAAGDRQAAVAAHQIFESATVDARPDTALGWLEAAEAPLRDRLGTVDHPSLLPLALFYRDLLGSHLGAGRLTLAHRAESVAEKLLLRLAAGAPDDAERQLAAAALEGLAADLISIGAVQRATALVRSAAELAPARSEIWVALAALLERSGELEEAGRTLDRALELDPGQREARLRRARIDVRRGARALAAARFEELLADPVADWVGVVAAQERTRISLEAGEAESAAALLVRLVDRWPEEPSLWVALAYSAERAGHRAESRGAVERATHADRAFATAPRKLYAEPPRATLAAGTGAVETAALARLDSLAAVLAAPGWR